MNTYILSQIMALVSTAVLIIYSVMKVNRSTILVCNVVINFLLAVHYFLLTDYTGALCSGVTTFMVWVFYYKKYLKKFGLTVPLLFMGIFIGAGIMTWSDGWSVIPVIGNILLIIALWNDDENFIKLIFIIVGILWMILNIHLKSIVNIFGQILALSSNILYFARICKSA